MGSGEATGIGFKLSERGGAPVALLTVDNRDKLNILDSGMIAALGRAIERVAADGAVRAMVLTGAGERAFIGGADVREMAVLDPAGAREFITGLHQVCAGLRALKVPVIARIQGYCLGAGLEVAASCDLRLAADDAIFGMPEVLVGIPSVIEAALLPRLIGMGRARELVLTGRRVDAAEAESWGLVQRVVPADGLDGALDGWLEAIIACGPEALRLQKALIREWENRPLDEAIAAGIDAFAEAYEGDEPRRMMRAFLERKR